MDPLSDVLSLLKTRSFLSAGLNAGGDWSLNYPYQGAFLKCNAIIRGGCWLCIEGVAEAMRLGAGDCFVVASGRPFRLCSDVNVPPVDAKTALSPTPAGGVATYNGGGDCLVIGSRFEVSGPAVGALLKMLPPIAHIRGESNQAALRWSIERMMEELRDPKPGGTLVVQQLAYLMLVQTLRLQLEQSAGAGVGWFTALADPQMNAAISAMHGDPARRWTLQSLAGCALMSRSAFACKFKATVGASPLDYLTRWRMLLAADRLASADESVGIVAQAVGYESESAFSTAFKRTMGCSPRQYRRAPATPQFQ